MGKRRKSCWVKLNKSWKYKKEFSLTVADNKRFFYDFAMLDSMKIIEYNGIKYHTEGNKERDVKKEQVAVSNGFKVLTVWSDQLFDKNIECCLNFIKGI